MSQYYWVQYRDLRPQNEYERTDMFERRYGKTERAQAAYTYEEAVRLKQHYERGGLSDVEIVPAGGR